MWELAPRYRTDECFDESVAGRFCEDGHEGVHVNAGVYCGSGQ